jgi:hypothetical protein
MTQTEIAQRRGVLARVPSWLISVMLHTILLVALGLTIHAAPRGVQTEAVREVGIAIKRVNEAGEQYFESEGDEPAVAPAPAEAAGGTSGPLSDVVNDRPPVDLKDVLPKLHEGIGAGAMDTGANPSAMGLTQGAAGSSQLKPGFARTKVYGIAGEGQKFVYVFDRSASMGDGGNGVLNSAKAELLASIDQLGPTQMFQIVFYNEKPTIFPLGGSHGKLVFGTDINKRAAKNFVGGIVADGGTNHLAAIEVALRLDADVIYFLTDADQPGLSPGQMLRIRDRNDHAVLHCIEFGIGAKSSTNFLQTLAQQSGGQYVYFDLARGAP